MNEQIKYSIVGMAILFFIFICISTFMEIIGIEYNKFLYWIIFFLTCLVYSWKECEEDE